MLKQVITENRDLIIKAAITGSGAIIANLEMVEMIFRILSGMGATLVAILTVIKLAREIWKKQKNK